MSYLSTPNKQPLDLFKNKNAETLFHQRRVSKEKELNLESRAAAIEQGYGAIVPVNKNLYYTMKARLENIVRTSNGREGGQTSRQPSQTSGILKDLLRESQVSHEQSFNRTSQGFASAMNSEPLYPANNHRKLYRNGIKVTLGNNPVKFSKRVFLFDKAPTYCQSQVNLQFDSKDTEQIKLMPARRKISPIRQSQEKLITIDSNNQNFDKKAHQTYFNDFFGFTDKGRLQMNVQQPMTERVRRDFNILNNQPVSQILKYPGEKKAHSELKTQYNSPCRFYVRRKLEMDSNLAMSKQYQTTGAMAETTPDMSRFYRSQSSAQIGGGRETSSTRPSSPKMQIMRPVANRPQRYPSMTTGANGFGGDVFNTSNGAQQF